MKYWKKMGLKTKHLSKTMLAISILFLLSLSSAYLPSVCAEDYYADITIEVDNSGVVTIDGTTNHPNLLAENTEIYTSKKQSYWLLNITKDEVFSEYIFSVALPEGSSINYIKSSGQIRIEEELGNLVVKGFGENESLSITVQYQIGSSSDDENSMQIDLPVIILIFILVLSLITIIIFFIKPKSDKEPEKVVQPAHGYNLKGLNERQKKIVELLIERKRPLTQSDIQRELNIPKAAVSRNIRGLELKGIIEKEQIGMSNLIKLKKL